MGLEPERCVRGGLACSPRLQQWAGLAPVVGVLGQCPALPGEGRLDVSGAGRSRFGVSLPRGAGREPRAPPSPVGGPGCRDLPCTSVCLPPPLPPGSATAPSRRAAGQRRVSLGWGRGAAGAGGSRGPGVGAMPPGAGRLRRCSPGQRRPPLVPGESRRPAPSPTEEVSHRPQAGLSCESRAAGTSRLSPPLPSPPGASGCSSCKPLWRGTYSAAGLYWQSYEPGAPTSLSCLRLLV